MPLRGQPPAAPATPRSTASQRYVVFRLAGVDYGVPAHQVRHSLPATEATGPAVVFARQVYPLVDLRALFRVPTEAPADRLVLLVEVDGRRAGLVVDRLAGLLGVDEGAIAPLPAVFGGQERQWFTGLAAVGQRLLLVLRPAGVLDGRDRRMTPPPSPSPTTATSA